MSNDSCPRHPDHSLSLCVVCHIEVNGSSARSTPAEALDVKAWADGVEDGLRSLDVERLIDTSAATLVLEGVHQLQRDRGRLSKVTVEDMRRLLLLVVDASARLRSPESDR